MLPYGKTSNGGLVMYAHGTGMLLIISQSFWLCAWNGLPFDSYKIESRCDVNTSNRLISLGDFQIRILNWHENFTFNHGTTDSSSLRVGYGTLNNSYRMLSLHVCLQLDLKPKINFADWKFIFHLRAVFERMKCTVSMNLFYSAAKRAYASTNWQFI